jgi:putative DNA primase/helicase
MTEGYDPQTRILLMQPPAMPAIPEKPTRRDAERALALLKTLLSEFPFKNDASLSVALSAQMTPVCRGALTVVPLHLVKAPVPGSGKSYLMDTVSAIATGEICPVIAAASEEETEKRLGACLLAGQAIISIDNLDGELKGDFLCQAVERPRPQIRVLGKSERVTIENRTTIFATGNNPTVHGDMVRRTLVCSLDPKLERPELRKFHDNPMIRITNERGKYVAAILTIVRAYLAAGEPCKTQPLNSFEQWSRLIREPLLWLGCADPVQTIEESREEDPVMNSLRQFLEAWKVTIGANRNYMTCGEIINAAYHTDDFDSVDMTPLQAAITTVIGAHGDLPKRLGRWLKGSKDRIINGLSVVGQMDKDRKVYIWGVSSDEL